MEQAVRVGPFTVSGRRETERRIVSVDEANRQMAVCAAGDENGCADQSAVGLVAGRVADSEADGRLWLAQLKDHDGRGQRRIFGAAISEASVISRVEIAALAMTRPVVNYGEVDWGWRVVAALGQV